MIGGLTAITVRVDGKVGSSSAVIDAIRAYREDRSCLNCSRQLWYRKARTWNGLDTHRLRL